MARVRAVLVALAAAAVAAALAAPAPAATYSVNSCRLPDGRPIPFTGWQPRFEPGPGAGPGVGVSFDCAGAGLTARTGDGASTPPGTYAQWAFAAPRDTRIASYQLTRQATGLFFEDFVGVHSGYRLVARGPAGELLLESCPPFGGPANACVTLPPVGVGSLPGGFVELAARTGCWEVLDLDTCPGSDDDEFPDGSTSLAIRSAVVTLEDVAAPRIRSLSGEDAVGSGGGLRVSASDAGGGVRAVTLELDGRPLRSFSLCEPPFTQPVPCPPEIEQTFPLDLAGVRRGTHSLRVLVTDATGANTSASSPRTLEVTGIPRARLTARVVTRRGKRVDGRRPRAVGYGSPVRLEGVLTTPEGERISGARLAIFERVRAPGRRWRRTGRVTTDGSGAYARRLARGPSRELRVTLRLPGLAADSASARTQLRVRAPVRLSVSRTRLPEGTTIRFSGALTAGPRPRTGKLVLLQVRDRGAWRTFANVRADRRRGRFAYSYRFPAIGATRVHLFRARVPRDGAYPFDVGISRGVTVTVSGAG
jgi:hypothetical protein